MAADNDIIVVSNGKDSHHDHGSDHHKRQSPIDISNNHAKWDPSLGCVAIDCKYKARDVKRLHNTGFTFQLNLDEHSTSELIALGLFDEPYKLIQVHAHWGEDGRCGSEHRVDGKSFAAEVHFVHMKASCNSFEEAVNQGDGLAVLGVFLEETHKSNPKLVPLMELLPKVHKKNDSVELVDGFDLNALLPEDKTQFWTYDGSLTTPPYSECVKWTVLKNTVPISHTQLGVFRSMTTVHDVIGLHHQVHIKANYRRTQPLQGRLIRQSFA
jgi:carbonic anhydrase